MGYHRAGFDVVGVDVVPQPRYPFAFMRFDALELLAMPSLAGVVNVIHASPPCQAFTIAQRINGRDHPDLLGPTRDALEMTGVPYVIENVPRAPMRADVMLCGSMFGLDVQRHRLFESNVPLGSQPTSCNHVWTTRTGRPVGVYGHTGISRTFDPTRRGSGNHGWSVADWRQAMGIDWTTRDELAQAIPPAYTEHVGRQLLEAIR
jgi:DNA (cytosine-5)-methyltransferase 1